MVLVRRAAVKKVRSKDKRIEKLHMQRERHKNAYYASIIFCWKKLFLRGGMG